MLFGKTKPVDSLGGHLFTSAQDFETQRMRMKYLALGLTIAKDNS